MKPIIIKPKDRQEWLKAREDGIGASDVGTLVGLNPWSSRLELYLRKIGELPPIEETESMHWGHKLEKEIADEWEERTGGKYVRSSAKDIIYQDPEHPWRKCTPDRIAYEIDENGKKHKVLLEIKTSQVDFDEIPDQYLCQVMYQMHITGIHVCYLCWLVRGNHYGHVRIEYDKEFAEWLVKEVDTFYLENVQKRVEPEPITVTDFVLKGSDPGTMIEADDEALAQVLSLRTIKQAISEKEEEETAISDAVKLYMGEKESLTYNGKVLATWKTSAKSRIFRLSKNNIDELLNQQENGS